MGMFDSIYLKVKCPNCGEEKQRECQTKDLDSDLLHLEKGDSTNYPDYPSVECIVGCDSLQCGKEVISSTTGLPMGYRQEKYFYIEVLTPLGLITGEYKYL